MAEENDITPTGMAKFFFTMASDVAYRGAVGKGLNPADDSEVLRRIAEGLFQMAIGLKATYLSLEETKALIRQQKP